MNLSTNFAKIFKHRTKKQNILFFSLFTRIIIHVNHPCIIFSKTQDILITKYLFYISSFSNEIFFAYSYCVKGLVLITDGLVCIPARRGIAGWRQQLLILP